MITIELIIVRVIPTIVIQPETYVRRTLQAFHVKIYIKKENHSLTKFFFNKLSQTTNLSKKSTTLLLYFGLKIKKINLF